MLPYIGQFLGACVHITAISASVLTWMSFLCTSLCVLFCLLQRHQSLDSEPTLFQDDLISILMLIISAKTLVQIRSQVDPIPGGHEFGADLLNPLHGPSVPEGKLRLGTLGRPTGGRWAWKAALGSCPGLADSLVP